MPDGQGSSRDYYDELLNTSVEVGTGRVPSASDRLRRQVLVVSANRVRQEQRAATQAAARQQQADAQLEQAESDPDKYTGLLRDQAHEVAGQARAYAENYPDQREEFRTRAREAETLETLWDAAQEQISEAGIRTWDELANHPAALRAYQVAHRQHEHYTNAEQSQQTTQQSVAAALQQSGQAVPGPSRGSERVSPPPQQAPQRPGQGPGQGNGARRMSR